MNPKIQLLMIAVFAILVLSCGKKDQQTGVTTTESGSIVGYVKHPGGKPAGNLLVLLLESEDGQWVEIAHIKTDEKGYYQFANVIPGDYVVQVQISASESLQLSVSVEEGSEEIVTFEMDTPLISSTEQSSSEQGSSGLGTSSSVLGESSQAQMSSAKTSSSSAVSSPSSSSQIPLSSSAGAALSIPVLISGAVGQPVVAYGSAHGLALRADSSLWSWGVNYSKQLGTGSAENYDASPAKIGSSKWIWVEAGDFHSLALQSDGTLWGWGDNVSGQLGQGDTLPEPTPRQIGTKQWVWVSTGGQRVAAIDSEHHLWTWGGDSAAIWGLPSWTANQKAPTQVGSELWDFVAAGAFHYLAIRSDSSLFAWGANSRGQLGLGDYVTRTSPTQVGNAKWIWASAGIHASYAIRSDSTLWVWGRNAEYQLGLTATVDQNTPQQVGSGKWKFIRGAQHSVVAVSASGALIVWGNYENSYIPLELSSQGWDKGGIGLGVVVGQQSGGLVQAIGNNTMGQLGNGTTQNATSLVSVLLP